MNAAEILAREFEEWESGLRIADCGFMNLSNRGLEIEIESFINPQSAIRNPLTP